MCHRNPCRGRPDGHKNELWGSCRDLWGGARVEWISSVPHRVRAGRAEPARMSDAAVHTLDYATPRGKSAPPVSFWRKCLLIGWIGGVMLWLFVWFLVQLL